MSNVIETLSDEATGCRVEIAYDEYPESPRDWTNVFSLCLRSRDYTLVETDIEPYIQEAQERIDERVGEIEEAMDRPYRDGESLAIELDKELAGLLEVTKDGGTYPRNPTLEEVEEVYGGRIFPVYAYIHSGIALSCNRRGQFGDPWDSGRLGYAMVTNETIQKEFLAYHPNGDVDAWLFDVLTEELNCLEDYWQGSVYCIFCYFPDGEICSDCESWSGIYDHDAWDKDGHLQSLARESLDSVVERYLERTNGGMLALDQFSSTELVASS